MTRKIVFLDRDGTINVDRGYVARADQWEFIAGVLPALRSLRQAGFALAVVTNQSGIARGFYTSDDVDRLHAHMLSQLGANGIEIDAVAYCPHGPEEECRCRKPRRGMADEIATKIGTAIDYEASWTVGDKPADIAYGDNLRTRTVLLESQYWQAETLTVAPTHVAGSLQQAAELILRGPP